MNISKVSKICKALGEENRVSIVKLLTDGERCACDLLKDLNITQPTLSHHMKVLSECYLIITRKEGKWSYYSLDCETLTEFRAFIASLDCNKSRRRCSCS